MREEDCQVEKEKNPEIFIINEKQEKAFKLVRVEGVLQAEVKTKTRDRKVPPLVYVDAIEIIDQVAAAMNREERLLAYEKLAARLNKNTDLS